MQRPLPGLHAVHGSPDNSRSSAAMGWGPIRRIGYFGMNLNELRFPSDSSTSMVIHFSLLQRLSRTARIVSIRILRSPLLLRTTKEFVARYTWQASRYSAYWKRRTTLSPSDRYALTAQFRMKTTEAMQRSAHNQSNQAPQEILDDMRRCSMKTNLPPVGWI